MHEANLHKKINTILKGAGKGEKNTDVQWRSNKGKTHTGFFRLK